MRLALAAALLTGCGAPPAAAPAQAESVAASTPCTIGGWSTDRDPAGLNVRAEPRADAAVVGRLPAVVEGGDALPGGAGPSFEITEARDGWLRINGATDDPGLTGRPARPTYNGPGWVSGRLVGFAVQSGQGRSRPDAAAPVIVTLKDAGGDSVWLTEVGAVERVVGCSGDWAEIEARLAPPAGFEATADVAPAAQVRPGVFRAWFRNVCPRQETTCEGVAD